MIINELFERGLEWDFMMGYHPARQGGAIGIVKAEFEIEIIDPNSSKMFKNYEVEFNRDLDGDDLANVPELVNAINKGNSVWKVAFGLRNHRDSTSITGTGDELKVFSTVLDIMKVCSTKYKMWNLMFTADEPNRAKLYNRMSRTLAAGEGFDAYTAQELDLQLPEENTLFLFKK